mmetsp:Transcript_71342/g.196992  ORF Transcript_71342/g.196992 Transcript_71342/m.196992 type:complete len:210 (-) Transcript_71342:184-813(-)
MARRHEVWGHPAFRAHQPSEPRLCAFYVPGLGTSFYQLVIAEGTRCYTIFAHSRKPPLSTLEVMGLCKDVQQRTILHGSGLNTRCLHVVEPLLCTVAIRSLSACANETGVACCMCFEAICEHALESALGHLNVASPCVRVKHHGVAADIQGDPTFPHARKPMLCAGHIASLHGGIDERVASGGIRPHLAARDDLLKDGLRPGQVACLRT